MPLQKPLHDLPQVLPIHHDQLIPVVDRGIFVRAGAQYQKDRRNAQAGGQPAPLADHRPLGPIMVAVLKKHRIRRKLGHRLAYQGVLRLDEPVFQAHGQEKFGEKRAIQENVDNA